MVIIGQDPYHNPNQANGLAFSVPMNIKHPPSLVNIFKEIEQDLSIKYPLSGDLSHWIKQGVLLLNSTLTVRKNKPGSHQNRGWENFTNEVIKLISATSSGSEYINSSKSCSSQSFLNYCKAISIILSWYSSNIYLSSDQPSALIASSTCFKENERP